MTPQPHCRAWAVIFLGFFFVSAAQAQVVMPEGSGTPPVELDASPAAIETLVDTLAEDPSPSARARAAESLGELGLRLGTETTRVIETLLDATQDPEADVRAEALWALGEIGPPLGDALPTLRRTLGDPDPWVAVKALNALEAYRSAAAVAVGDVLALAAHEVTMVRSAVISTLDALRVWNADVERVLGQLMDDPEGAVRSNAEATRNNLILRFESKEKRPSEVLEATLAGHLPRLHALVASGADPDTPGDFGMTPLMEVASRGRLAVLPALLDLGADIDRGDWVGRTPLMYAAGNCEVEAVEALLDRGASLEPRDRERKNALVHAMDRGCDTVETILKAAGATTGMAGLLEAAIRGDLQAVSEAVHLAETLEAVDGTDRTALHWAAFRGDTGILQALIDAGAELDPREQIGMTPLMLAVVMGHREVVDRLLDAGADLDAHNRFGLTPLRHAVRRGHFELAATLLARGADPAFQAKDGERAWDDALARDDSRFLKLLEDAGGRFDPPEQRSEILDVRLVAEGPDLLVVDVDYYDDGVVESLWVGGITMFEGRSTGHWGYKSSKTQPGHGCGRVVITMNDSAPETYSSDALKMDLYVGGGGPMATLTVPYEKTWRRSGRELPPIPRQCGAKPTTR